MENNSMEVPQKTKYRTTIWSSNPTPEHVSRQNYNSKRYMHLYVHSSTILQYLRHGNKLNVCWWMNGLRRCGTYVQWNATNPWKNAICSNMDGTRDSHIKWNKSERERQIPYDISYMWNLKHGTNEPVKQKQTNRHREQICGCGVWGRRGMDWEFGVSRWKLL